MGVISDALEGRIARRFDIHGVAWFRRAQLLYMACHITADMFTDLYSAAIYYRKGEVAWGVIMFGFVILTNVVNAGIYFYKEREWGGFWLGLLGFLPIKHAYTVLRSTSNESLVEDNDADTEKMGYAQGVQASLEAVPHTLLQLYILVNVYLEGRDDQFDLHEWAVLWASCTLSLLSASFSVFSAASAEASSPLSTSVLRCTRARAASWSSLMASKSDASVCDPGL